MSTLFDWARSPTEEVRSNSMEDARAMFARDDTVRNWCRENDGIDWEWRGLCRKRNGNAHPRRDNRRLHIQWRSVDRLWENEQAQSYSIRSREFLRIRWTYQQCRMWEDQGTDSVVLWPVNRYWKRRQLDMEWKTKQMTDQQCPRDLYSNENQLFREEKQRIHAIRAKTKESDVLQLRFKCECTEKKASAVLTRSSSSKIQSLKGGNVFLSPFSSIVEPDRFLRVTPRR